MRRWMPVVAAALLLTAPMARAAPGCWDKNGGTIKCGVPGAMPVGWSLSPRQLLDRQMSRPADPGTDNLLKAISVIGLLLALIALMPEFDGSHGEDWDRQEGDKDARR
jgi:hypothetical protein